MRLVRALSRGGKVNVFEVLHIKNKCSEVTSKFGNTFVPERPFLHPTVSIVLNRGEETAPKHRNHRDDESL